MVYVFSKGGTYMKRKMLRSLTAYSWAPPVVPCGLWGSRGKVFGSVGFGPGFHLEAGSYSGRFPLQPGTGIGPGWGVRFFVGLPA